MPKCEFPEYQNFNEYPWNCIHLTFKEHRLAHIMLYKAFPKSNLVCALRFFECNIRETSWYNDGSRNIRTTKEYAKEYNLIPGRLSTDSWKNKTYVSKDGKNYQIYSSELDYYLSLGYKKFLIKKKTVSVTNGIINTAIVEDLVDLFLQQNPSYRKGYIVQSERRKNNTIYHKDSVEIRVMPHEIEIMEQNGWIKGRSARSTNAFRKASNQIHKGDIGKRVSDENLQNFLDDGWVLGIPKKQIEKSKKSQENFIRVYDKITLKEHKINRDKFDPSIHNIGRSPKNKNIKNFLELAQPSKQEKSSRNDQKLVLQQ